jgi:phosphate acetyltransferase
LQTQKGEVILAIMNEFWEKAKSDIKRIVLPEGEEERTIKASFIIQREGLAEVTLLGNAERIKNKAKDLEAAINGI